MFHSNCIRCAVVDEALGQQQCEYKCTGTRPVIGHYVRCVSVCDCFNSLGGYVGLPFENNKRKIARRMLLNISGQGKKKTNCSTRRQNKLPPIRLIRLNRRNALNENAWKKRMHRPRFKTHQLIKGIADAVK